LFFQPDEYDIRDKHPAAFFIRKHFISDDGTTEDDILNLNHGGLQFMFTVLFYPIAKRTPSIGAVGYYRMGGDEFARYLLP
jgi:hypothetical protein